MRTHKHTCHPTSHIHKILLRSRATFPHKHSSKPSKKKSESDTAPPGNALADLGGDEAKELEKIRSMEKEELQYMRELRAENSQKVEHDEELKSTGTATSPVLYCFCRCPESGYMLQWRAESGCGCLGESRSKRFDWGGWSVGLGRIECDW